MVLLVARWGLNGSHQRKVIKLTAERSPIELPGNRATNLFSLQGPCEGSGVLSGRPGRLMRRHKAAALKDKTVE